MGGATAQGDRAEPRMSPDETTRILARAIQLQDTADGRPGEGLSLLDVQDIAAQVGVEPAAVQRAIAEVRRASATRGELSLTERVLGPSRLTGVIVLPVGADVARRAAERWMLEDEGLRVVGARDGAVRLARDPRILAGLRSGLGVTRGEGVLRGLDEVSLHVAQGPVGAEVAVEADTSTIQRTTRTIAALSAAAGVVAGAVNAGVIPDTAVIGSDIAQFGASWLVTTLAGAGVATTVARQWTRKVRRAVDLALDGISLSAERPGELPAPPPRGGWRDTVRRWLGV